MKKGDPAPIRQRLASRRDEAVVCERCGARVERRIRGQRFCSARCRERARGRSRKVFLGKDTRAPTPPPNFRNKFNNLQAINDGTSPAKNALLARAIRVECFDSHQWVEKVSPDGVTKDELKAVLRALERKGMIESRIDADGEVRWRITAKGIIVDDGEADRPEDSGYGLDS
jgi:hypothetical protein